MSGQSDGESWLPTLHTCYYNGFFLLRTPVSFIGKPAEIKLTEDGSPTLHCGYSRCSIGVNISRISRQVANTLVKHGVYHVDTFYHEDVPLFSVVFSSKSSLKQFLTFSTEKLKDDLQVAFVEKSRKFSTLMSLPMSTLPLEVEAELYYVTPNHQNGTAQVELVTLANYSHYAAQWRGSKVFEFQSHMFSGRQPFIARGMYLCACYLLCMYNTCM